jgi:hypothetical protein
MLRSCWRSCSEASRAEHVVQLPFEAYSRRPVGARQPKLRKHDHAVSKFHFSMKHLLYYFPSSSSRFLLRCLVHVLDGRVHATAVTSGMGETPVVKPDSQMRSSMDGAIRAVLDSAASGSLVNYTGHALYRGEHDQAVGSAMRQATRV